MAGARKRRPSKARIELTESELCFLRDVFGVVTPVTDEEGEVAEGCVCGMLAEATDRVAPEASLWSKIVQACRSLSVAVGDEAPTYALSAAEVPTMRVYELER